MVFQRHVGRRRDIRSRSFPKRFPHRPRDMFHLSTSLLFNFLLHSGGSVGGLARSKTAWMKRDEWKDTPLHLPVLNYLVLKTSSIHVYYVQLDWKYVSFICLSRQFTQRSGYQYPFNVYLGGHEGVKLQNLPGKGTYLESTNNRPARVGKRDGTL
ncbi:hypothetical protein F4678DRAFT_375097 [Xylaria arbuscula]|nr:hypothetical protein F4678DRAFT_375097 [Xylaria arbuscula]